MALPDGKHVKRIQLPSGSKRDELKEVSCDKMGLENEIKGLVYKGLEIICYLHYEEGSACGT